MDQQAEALMKLFWSSVKANDQETMETARTALYNHLIGQIVENFRNTARNASQCVLTHPKVLEVIHHRTQADKAVLDRMAKGYDYLSRLYKEDPPDRTEKVLKALDLIDRLDDFLNRPQSMIQEGDGWVKIMTVQLP